MAHHPGKNYLSCIEFLSSHPPTRNKVSTSIKMRLSLLPITIKSHSAQIMAKMWRTWKPDITDDNVNGPVSVEDSLAVLSLDLACDLAIIFPK